MTQNIIGLAEGFRSELLRGDAKTVLAMTRRWGAVEALLSISIEELANEIAALQASGADVPKYKLWQLGRFQTLLNQIAGEMAKYGQWAIIQMQEDAAKAQQLGASHAKQMLLASMDAARAAQLTFDKLPTEAVENITALAQQGQPLEKLLKAAYPAAVDGIVNQLIYGTAVGRNPRETARLAVKKGLVSGLNHILLVARDQQIRNYREMVRHQYGRSGVVYGYMRKAARNTRTCMACIAQDGRIYAPDEPMALHPQDRCAMIPLVTGYPVPKLPTARDWFEKLDPSEQKKMMGNGKWEAWQDGLFDFRQLVTTYDHPVWGPSAKVTPLKDLLGGRGGVGGVPIDPAILLARHKASAPTKAGKRQTVAVDKDDQALLEKLLNEITAGAFSDVAKKGITKALMKVLAGGAGLVYLNANGGLEGAIAYETAVNPKYLKVAGMGLAADSEGLNLKALADLADVAAQQNQGVQLYVPKALVGQYQAWGFTSHKSAIGGSYMQLQPEDVVGFKKDPENFGEQKKAQLAAAAQAALLDPNAAFTFRSGQPIDGLPFKSVQMTAVDFAAQTKALAHDPPLDIDDPKRHPAAGMLLFTPDGKLVLVDPTNQYGGYTTTFPKGTQEEGMGLQATAVKEVWEESGFKAKVLGTLGDYKKATSVNRFYVGVVEDGAPWDAHYETEAVRIVPLDKVDVLLNVGTDKGIFKDLMALVDQSKDGGDFSIAKLEEVLDHLDAAAADAAAQEAAAISAQKAQQQAESLAKSAPAAPETAVPAQPNQPATNAPTLGDVEPLPGRQPPAQVTKKVLVDHLVKITGAAKWKATVMTKAQLVRLFDYPIDEAAAAIDAAGTAHTLKYKKGTAVSPPPAKVDPAGDAYRTVAAWHTAGHADPLRLSIEELKLAYAYAKTQANAGMLAIVRDAIVAAEALPIVEQVKAGHGDKLSLTELQQAAEWLRQVGPAGTKLKGLVNGLIAAKQPDPQPTAGERAFEKLVSGAGWKYLPPAEAKQALAYMRANNLNVFTPDEMQELINLANAEAIRIPPGLSYEEKLGWLSVEGMIDLPQVYFLTPEQVRQVDGLTWSQLDYLVTEAVDRADAYQGQMTVKAIESWQLAGLKLVHKLTATYNAATLRKALTYAQAEKQTAVVDAIIEAMAQLAGTDTAVAAPSFPSPPEQMTKKDLVAALVAMHGVAKWKLGLIPAKELQQLATKSARTIATAADQAAADHAAKYKKGSPPPVKQTAVKQPTPGETAWQQYQASGAAAMTPDGLQAAITHAQRAGVAQAVVDQMQTEYQTAVGDPFLLPDIDATWMTKKNLVAAVKDASGLPIYKLNTLKKAELQALIGQPVSQAYAALGIAFQPQATAVSPPPQSPTAVPTVLPPKGGKTIQLPADLGYAGQIAWLQKHSAIDKASLLLLTPTWLRENVNGSTWDRLQDVVDEFLDEIAYPNDMEAAAKRVLPGLKGVAAKDIAQHIAANHSLETIKLLTLYGTADGTYAMKDIFDAVVEALEIKAVAENTARMATAVGAPTPPPPPEDKPPLINGSDPADIMGVFDALDDTFPPGSPAGNGSQKAQTALADSDAPTFVYMDGPAAKGVIALDPDYNATMMKVVGAAFADTKTNLQGIADAANYALAQGKSLYIYVPPKFQGQYKKWGFVGDSTNYLTLPTGAIPQLVTLAGKKPVKPPPPQAPMATAGKIGYMGLSKEKVIKLTKGTLETHLAQALNLPKEKLGKYTKKSLVAFMAMTKQEAFALVAHGKMPPGEVETPAPFDFTPKPVAKKRPLPENLPAFQLPDPPGFPADVGKLKVVGGLGGSTGAQLVEDPATGKRYVRKSGNSKGHLLEEAYADAAYQVAGLNVPGFKIYETSSGPVKLSEYKDDLVSLGEALGKASPSQKKKLLAEVRKGFAADALMGNWDVVGASLDNVMIDGNGRAWRIDNGGSFRYRAQGKKKEKEFVSDYPVELWTLRDKSMGPKNAQIFGGMDIYEVMESVRELLPKSDAILAAVPDELREMVNGRLFIMEDLLGTSDTFRTDSWVAEYTDGFLEQSTYIRRAGLIDALPQQMKQGKKGSTTVYDEKGKKWDQLRGPNSHVETFAKYMQANGGRPDTIRHWMSSQAGSSWSPASQALKWLLVKSRGGNVNNYYWRDGTNHAGLEYKGVVGYLGGGNQGEETYRRTVMMWHAWVYESLRHMEFKRKKGDYLEIVRTEDPEVIQNIYGFKIGNKNVKMPRGACESGSIYRAKNIVAGGEVTRQRVPIHRIMGYYWADRPTQPGSGGGFLGESENEFVFMPEGIPFDYVDSIGGSKGVEAYWND